MFDPLGISVILETCGYTIEEGQFLVDSSQERKTRIGSDFTALKVEDEFLGKFGSNLGSYGSTLCAHEIRLVCRDYF